ncbi:MAG: phosphatase PAP2 family protein [bacterium]|nr:phosphatase PAP2 family protein [bacterium]
MSFDIPVHQFLNNLSGQSKLLDLAVVFFASYLGPILALIAIFLIFKSKDKFHYFVLTFLAMLLSRGLIAEIIRIFYHRPRPFVLLDVNPLIEHVANAAFPSGHATILFTLAMSMWLLNRRQGTWFFVGASLMGLARVIAGLHWPTDILAGAAIGLLSIVVLQYLLPRKAVPISPISSDSN